MFCKYLMDIINVDFKKHKLYEVFMSINGARQSAETPRVNQPVDIHPVGSAKVRKRDIIKGVLRSIGERFFGTFFGTQSWDQTRRNIDKNAEAVRERQVERKALKKHSKDAETNLPTSHPKKRLSKADMDEETRLKIERGFEFLKESDAPRSEPIPEAWLQELRDEESSLAGAMNVVVEVASHPVENLSKVVKVAREQLPTPEEILESATEVFDSAAEAAEEFAEDPQGTAMRMVDYVDRTLPSPDKVFEKIEEKVASAVPVFITAEEVESGLESASKGKALYEEMRINYSAMDPEEKDKLSMSDRGEIKEATRVALQVKEAEQLRRQDSYWTPNHIRTEVQGSVFARRGDLAPYVQVRRAKLIEEILKKSSLYAIDDLKGKSLEELEEILSACETVDSALEMAGNVIESAGTTIAGFSDPLKKNFDRLIGSPEVREVKKGELPMAPIRTHRPRASVRAQRPAVPGRQRAPEGRLE